MFHGRADLRWADDAAHGALQVQDLSSGIQGLVLDDVLGDVGISGVSPARDDDEPRVVGCASAWGL